MMNFIIKITSRQLFRGLQRDSLKILAYSTNVQRHENVNTEVSKIPKKLIDPRKVSPLYELKPDEEIDLSVYHKELPATFNLAAYANKSKVIQELIKLGVELYKVEQNVELCEYILKLDFNKDIAPYIRFLHDNGVNSDQLGAVISKNPAIFKEDLENIEVRINYLKSKKFTNEMIANMITKHPKFLSNKVEEIDRKLGFLQQTFDLKGDQVREVASKYPQIFSVKDKHIKINQFVFLEEMGFEDYQIRNIIVAHPRYLRRETESLMQTFDYITKDMQVSKDLIYKQPEVLNYRRHKIKPRHLFLKFIGRAQYNPLLPGYVSLSKLVHGGDSEFCENVAKTSVITYNEFLKTL